MNVLSAADKKRKAGRKRPRPGDFDLKEFCSCQMPEEGNCHLRQMQYMVSPFLRRTRHK